MNEKIDIKFIKSETVSSVEKKMFVILPSKFV